MQTDDGGCVLQGEALNGEARSETDSAVFGEVDDVKSVMFAKPEADSIADRKVGRQGGEIDGTLGQRNEATCAGRKN